MIGALGVRSNQSRAEREAERKKLQEARGWLLAAAFLLRGVELPLHPCGLGCSACRRWGWHVGAVGGMQGFLSRLLHAARSLLLAVRGEPGPGLAVCLWRADRLAGCTCSHTGICACVGEPGELQEAMLVFSALH